MEVPEDSSNLFETRGSNLCTDLRWISPVSERGMARDFNPLHRGCLSHSSRHALVSPVHTAAYIFLHTPSMEGTNGFAQGPKLIVPLVIERKRVQASADASYKRPNDLLQWMVDAANESEGKPEKLAHRQLLLTLAAIHTSTMAATHVILDLCARPEYIQPIREEIQQAVKVDNGWQK